MTARLHAAATGATAALSALLAACSPVINGDDPSAPPQSHQPTTVTAPLPPTSTGGPSPTTAVPAPALPRGGRVLFPAYRLVGYAGYPGSAALGRLGIGDLDARVREIEKVAGPLAGGRTVMPVLELIATVVRSEPGGDGMYRTRTEPATIDRYLRAARRAKGILLLNIQPGRARFIDEVRHYERWLAQPDVGVALDPEWAMGPHQVPMREFGSTTGAEIDGVAAYLSALVKRHNLPEKVLVYHQLAPSIVRREAGIRARPGVVLVKSIDGIGSRAMKLETYDKLVAHLPRPVHAGFKLFYSEDGRFGPLMTPAQVLALRPQPEYVLYE
ncbi:hypothetical protein ACWEOW_03260 [Monashia sp. NPDC004114]